MNTSVQAIHCFLGGILLEEMNFSKREVHQLNDSDLNDVVYAFDVPRVNVSGSL